MFGTLLELLNSSIDMKSYFKQIKLKYFVLHFLQQLVPPSLTKYLNNPLKESYEKFNAFIISRSNISNNLADLVLHYM